MKSEFEFINYHLNRIRKIQSSMNNKRIFVECFPTDDNAICLPNSNFAVKEIFFDADESTPLPSSSVTGDEGWEAKWNKLYEQFKKLDEYNVNLREENKRYRKEVDRLSVTGDSEAIECTVIGAQLPYCKLCGGTGKIIFHNPTAMPEYEERACVSCYGGSSTSVQEEDAVNIVDWIRDNNFRKRYVGGECKWQVGTHLYSTLELYRLFKNKPTTPDSLPSSSVTGDSEEVERRTRIIEKLVKDDSMYHVHVQESYKEHRWQQFKKENNL